MSIAYSGDSITFPDLSVQNTSPTGFGFKNRIINGDMRIDKRNEGASVTATSLGFTLDRWAQYAGAGSITAQRTTSVVPAGFSYAYGITVATVNTRSAGDYSFMFQNIEGLNVADFDIGLSTAATVTLSFWVRSSISGLYSGVLASGNNGRTYGFTYTINAANTWEQKTVTVVGDTSGGKTSYPIDNTSGLRLKLDLGSGSNYQVTANSWQAATNKVGVAGTVNWAQTSGATFYITGVQLEKGSTATSFDYRDYGRELIMCQRYYFKGSGDGTGIAYGYTGGISETYRSVLYKYPQTMRAIPTLSFTWNTGSGAGSQFGSPDSASVYVNLSSTSAVAYINAIQGTAEL
jgi:hypothetical protein